MDKSRNMRKGREGRMGGEEKGMNETSFELLNPAMAVAREASGFSAMRAKKFSRMPFFYPS